MPIDLSSKRIAVTGASGFIGMHLLRGLHAAGAEIAAMVAADKSTSRLDEIPFSVERFIIKDAAGLGDAIRQTAPHFVVHLSAAISIERSLRVLKETFEENVISTISLLTACTDIHAERVILMGSCEEYGQKHCPFDASLALDPNSPYGASKAAVAAYAHMFYGSFQLPTVVLRPSVVYGPGQSARMLISMVLQALAEGRTISVTEGRQTRDFVYVDDVVESILASLTAPNILGEAWNVGSGEVVTVRQCLELVERITGRPGLIQYGARPYANSERFHYEPIVENTYEALNWRPSVMLEEGLRRTWQAVQANQILTAPK
jgi:UDP-glucose 4-epimerase